MHTIFYAAPASPLPMIISKIDALCDLLQEVKALRRAVEIRAKVASHNAINQKDRWEMTRVLLEDHLRSPAMRDRVIGYATAAELGVLVDAPDVGAAISGLEGYPLRVLFWTAHRRMPRTWYSMAAQRQS